jgi:hypothetical protein
MNTNASDPINAPGRSPARDHAPARDQAPARSPAPARDRAPTPEHTPDHTPDHTHAHTLPIAIIGAGPVGLAAAAHLLSRGATPIVFEAGPSVGTSIRDWGHVRLFSPWQYLVDPAARALLERGSWRAPPAGHLPTGAELVRDYLEPLAAHPALATHIRTGHRVLAVSRRGFDKVRTPGRDRAPFELVVRRADGSTRRHLARAVIDASGTWSSPNPLGAGGLPAEGEAAAVDRIHYGIPDVLGTDRPLYRGARTLVVGSGHSSFNTVLDLATLCEDTPGGEIIWAVRRTQPGNMFGGADLDQLPARGRLGARLHQLVRTGAVRFETGFRTERIVPGPDGIRVESDDGRELGPVDRVVANTGFRPDLALLRELRLELDPWLEAPVRLAPLIDPNLHSCGTVPAHGHDELSHPDPDVFVVGMKSYGRAPTFLMLTGYEQVRSIAAGLTGDLEAARRVELVLPESGVCCTDPDSPSCGEGTSAPTASCGEGTPAPTSAGATSAPRVVAPVPAPGGPPPPFCG